MTNHNPIRAFRFKRTFYVDPGVPWFSEGDTVLAISHDEGCSYGILPRRITQYDAIYSTMDIAPFLERDMLEEITDPEAIKEHPGYSTVVDAFQKQAEICQNLELSLLSDMQELQERLASARSHSRRIDDIIKSL